MHFTIRMEHQIIILTALAGHRTGQVLPAASSVSQETSRGEAATSVCLCTAWSQKTANSCILNYPQKVPNDDIISFIAHTVQSGISSCRMALIYISGLCYGSKLQ